MNTAEAMLDEGRFYERQLVHHIFKVPFFFHTGQSRDAHVKDISSD